VSEPLGLRQTMHGMRFALVSRGTTATDEALAAARAPAWEPMSPEIALRTLRSGDAALGRLDVLPTLDGVEDGLWALGALAARGVIVLNEAAALLGTHDKLLTSRLLKRAGVSHPFTLHVRPRRPFPAVRPPVVVKPRYGSWGASVVLCEDERSLLAVLDEIEDAPWFRRHGALVQELVPPLGFDLRVLVAAGRVVGAAFRDAAPGEWRTNIALGGTRRSVDDVPHRAQILALRAAKATGTQLAGVDLLPVGNAWTVLEVNGAVEFTSDYRASGDVFAETAAELARAAHAVRDREAIAVPGR
jgi:RimK family alpha-L-glutamate ligase